MALWKHVGPWAYNYYDPDEDLKKLVGFEAIVSLWQERRQGRRVPAWRDFDFTDFKGWHGNLVVYEFSYDPFDWKVRLSGSNVDELFDRGLTGLDRGSVYENSIEKKEAGKFYEMTSRNLLIAHTTGPLNIRHRDFRHVCYLELPLCDRGDKATHAIELVLPMF